jgi:hypothetical protein
VFILEEKKYILKKLAPILVVGGLAGLGWSFSAGIMTNQLLVHGAIAGLMGAFAMTMGMMIVAEIKDMGVVVPQLVASNIGLEKVWTGVHFGTGASFGLGYIIISGILNVPLSILGAVVFAVLGPEMFLGLVILPDNGMGLFGKDKNPMLPMMTLVMHIIFGIVMGATLLYLIRT